ncbi:protein-tyrosine phosphatase [Saitoella complicata NRRL Y-17804]|nr:protein-tyrosine phosphatase [Saitoella complicata NRRL Y-17804]ODQ52992.1 protein-tyrosine phosphatase [Saitoella complicata NRRL Y-17804]
MIIPPFPLNPPDLFSPVVAPHIYRSGPLQPLNRPFLTPLNLRTIILLHADPTRTLQAYAAEQGIRLVQLGEAGWKPGDDGEGDEGGWRVMGEDVVREGIRQVLDRRNHPVLVIDSSGIQETGTLFGILRKLQHWSFASIVIEYRLFAGPNARYVNEQYIEIFDLGTLEIDEEHLPEWWVEQEKMWEEECRGVESKRKALEETPSNT